MFRVDRLKVKGTMKEEQLVMRELRTELGIAVVFIASGQDNAVDEDVDELPVQDLVLNVDNVFQADECDAFNYDVDEAPIAQTMFMENLSFANPVYDEVDLSYDSDILFEYMEDNAKPVVQNNVSSTPNDASMMIINEMHKQTIQYVFVKAHTKVVAASLTVELVIYRERVKLNNMKVHLDYLRHLKESVPTLHEIVKEARDERPLDRSLASTCLYAKHSHELLQYLVVTCLKDFSNQDKK
nr:retrovirus-related Pol polyprotein from transposon TNT 1-94 [Tanacetum cinerariifolium]